MIPGNESPEPFLLYIAESDFHSAWLPGHRDPDAVAALLDTHFSFLRNEIGLLDGEPLPVEHFWIAPLGAAPSAEDGLWEICHPDHPAARPATGIIGEEAGWLAPPVASNPPARHRGPRIEIWI